MLTILYTALGVIFGFVILILAIWFWLKYKFRKFTSKFAAEFADAMANARGFAPPLRIDLEPMDEPEWTDTEKIELITTALKKTGFEPDGLYESFAPVHLKILGFKNRNLPGYAAIYEIDQIGAIHLELVCELSDGTHITVTTISDDGMDHPEYSRIIRMDHLDLSEPEQVQELYQCMQDEINEKTIVDQTDKGFEEVFKKTWARSMDWRVERGGITTKEVLRVAEINGQPEPSEKEIELAKHPWKQQIDYFITDQIRKSYLKNTNMSGDEWEETVDRLVIIHEKSDLTRLISELADLITYDDDLDDDDDEQGEDAYLKMEHQLKAAFDSETSVIDGFRKAIELLPPKKEYTLHGSTDSPWRSEVYLSPNFYDEDDDDDF
ncbi:hypothetical protein [uncultured Gimesia sp.]|uniref:hypothetical protein n=1 Tax=uncultured Gimesia sp. TaxID=1678688 RepID=UPI0030DBF6BA|tara:strand:- start:88095 stop:89234 length:1140 start_codon:yes stop_codon:yes gene_type:complete